MPEKYLVSEMVEEICSSTQFTPELQGVITKSLGKFWENKIASIWTANDILEKAEELGYIIDEDDALDILYQLKDEFDASIGINWGVIEETIHLHRFPSFEECQPEDISEDECLDNDDYRNIIQD